MNLRNPFSPHDAQHRRNGDAADFPNGHDEPRWHIPGADWLSNLSGIWQYDDVAAEIGAESQNRVALVGRSGVGKRTLFNRLRGWELDWSNDRVPVETELVVDAFGLFLLADLPDHMSAGLAADIVLQLGDPALIIIMLDATREVDKDELRWIAALRTTGKPVLIVLNKVENPDKCVQTPDGLQQRLGAPIVPLSARSGLNVDDVLLPAMLDAVPRLAVPLAREIASLRRGAVRRVMRHSALYAALLGAQPFPMLEIPFLALVQVGLVMRIGAAYGHTPSGGVSREVAVTVGAVIVLQYLVQTIIKFVPILGSLVGAALSATATFLIGETAIRYYEAGATIPFPTLRQTTVWKFGRRKKAS